MPAGDECSDRLNRAEPSSQPAAITKGCTLARGHAQSFASVGGRGFEWNAGNASGARNHLQFCAMQMIGSVRVNDSSRCVMIHHDWRRLLPDRHFRALTAREFNNVRASLEP